MNYKDNPLKANLVLRLDPRLKEQLERYAESNDIVKSEIARRAITMFINEQYE